MWFFPKKISSAWPSPVASSFASIFEDPAMTMQCLTGPQQKQLSSFMQVENLPKFNEMTHDFSNLEVQPLHHLSLESPEMIHFRKQMDCMGPLILRLPKHATMPCHPVALPNKHLSHPKAASEPSQCFQIIQPICQGVQIWPN